MHRTKKLVRYYDLKQEARHEFTRVTLESLLRSATEEAARLEARRISLRRARARRRANELSAALATLAGRPTPTPHRLTAVFRIVTALWLLAIAETVAYVATWGINTGSGIAELPMLALSFAWFVLAAAVTTPVHDASRTDLPE